jgi:hypothetical protein
MAHEATDPAKKLVLLEMARLWINLAESLDGSRRSSLTELLR